MGVYRMSENLPSFDPDSDKEWRDRLTDIQYHVTRRAGTEPPNTGPCTWRKGRATIYAFAAGIFCSHLR